MLNVAVNVFPPPPALCNVKKMSYTLYAYIGCRPALRACRGVVLGPATQAGNVRTLACHFGDDTSALDVIAVTESARARSYIFR